MLKSTLKNKLNIKKDLLLKAPKTMTATELKILAIRRIVLKENWANYWSVKNSKKNQVEMKKLRTTKLKNILVSVRWFQQQWSSVRVGSLRGIKRRIWQETRKMRRRRKQTQSQQMKRLYFTDRRREKGENVTLLRYNINFFFSSYIYLLILINVNQVYWCRKLTFFS